MPTYEYRCKECGEHLEVVQSFTDDALTDCPACGTAQSLRKVFGNIGITFKGSGFYKTDNRSGSRANGSEKSESKSDSSSTKSDSSSGSGDSSSSSAPSASSPSSSESPAKTA